MIFEVNCIKTKLIDIPYIGKKTEESLNNIGIHYIEDLKGKNPNELYMMDSMKKGYEVDKCQLYLFKLAVYYADNKELEEEKLKWWYWKDKDYPEKNNK